MLLLHRCSLLLSHVPPDGLKSGPFGPVSSTLLSPPPEASLPLLPCLHNPIIPMYHVIFPFLQLFGMKTLHLGIKGWKLVFHLPAVIEVGCGILFRLLILSSVWTLLLAVENEGLPHYEACLRSVTTRLLGFYTTVWLGLYCLILGELSLKTQWRVLLGFVWYVCRLKLPHLCFCLIVRMGQPFWVVSYVLFWVFCLDWPSLLGLLVRLCCKDGSTVGMF
jgi:hypothetical protein